MKKLVSAFLVVCATFAAVAPAAYACEGQGGHPSTDGR